MLGVAVGRTRVALWWSPALLTAGLTIANVIRGGSLAFAAIGLGIATVGLLDLGRRPLRAAPIPLYRSSSSTDGSSRAAVTD